MQKKLPKYEILQFTFNFNQTLSKFRSSCADRQHFFNSSLSFLSAVSVSPYKTTVHLSLFLQLECLIIDDFKGHVRRKLKGKGNNLHKAFIKTEIVLYLAFSVSGICMLSSCHYKIRLRYSQCPVGLRLSWRSTKNKGRQTNTLSVLLSLSH